MDTGQNNYQEMSSLGSSEPDKKDTFAAASASPVCKKRSGWKIFWGIFTGLSVLGNIVLILIIIGMGVMLADTFGGFTTSSQYSGFTEQVLEPGSRTQKIAVINIGGLIGDEMADSVAKQVKAACQDNKVKAVIVKIDSPGGTVSASDRINYELKKLWKEHDKPTVAFMQGVAASGGYYSAVACQTIIAEPTAITGSIGVLMETFMVQGLLEDKLGVQAVVIKSGEKKDWPNPFKTITDEQKAYIRDKLITPAYDRFVSVVVDGRKSLQEEDIRKLADGSIYGAQEAYDNGLIDNIGYFEKAVSIAKKMAKAENAEVIEYHKVWSLGEWFGASTSSALPRLSRTTLTEISQPQLLYLWKGID